MHIVIPGALPEPEVATELAPHLAHRAPTLAHWLGSSPPRTVACPAVDTWCTPLEHWLLQARGFSPAQDEHISAGLGPMRLPGPDDDPIWLAELIHMAPSRDGAALLPADTLAITEEHSAALLETARGMIEDDGIKLTQETPTTWRVHWPEPIRLSCASPALVAVSAVNDWWPQALAARPWRRLVNSLQMAWYEHPVNQQRQHDGLAPINSLWLYGGARRSQLGRPLPDGLRIEPILQAHAVAQDWGSWIEALADLEQHCFAPLANTTPTLVLTGREHTVELDTHASWLRRLRPLDWRRWWCNR